LRAGERTVAINKVVPTIDEAVRDVRDGAVLLIGGFGGPGECPSYLIGGVARRAVKGLTIVGNLGGWGLERMPDLKERMRSIVRFPTDFYDQGLLVERGQVARGILSFPAAAGHWRFPIEDLIEKGEVEIELLSQGTLAEKIRAARAGIPAFYCPVGHGTVSARGKEVRTFEGRPCLLEQALKGDFSLIRAHQSDRYGNLVYRGTQRTFNATMAGASAITIAEVDEVVEVGELDAEVIVTPGVYVQRVVVRPPQPRPWNEPM
jgi:3-oxoadipate CoA-transferase, alpha subunit